MTEPVFNAIEDYTGHRPRGCPWRAFFDPFVQRVTRAYRFFESGQLAWAQPGASHRLVEGVGFYHSVDNLVWSKQLRSDEEQRKRARG